MKRCDAFLPRSLTRAWLVALCLTFLLTATDSRAVSRTFTVTNLVDGGPGSLRRLVLLSRDGDVFQFDPGLNGSTLLLRGELVIERSVSILGPGPANLIVSGGGTNRVFNVKSNDFGARSLTVFVAGLTISGGNGLSSPSFESSPSEPGGGIRNSATLTLSNCILSGHSTIRGGAILNTGRLTLQECLVRGNWSSTGGTLENEFGIVTLIDSVIRDNRGVGISSATGTVQMSECLLQGNRGGGLVNNRGTGTVMNCLFSGNSATGPSRANGGAIDFNYGTLTVKSSTFRGNWAENRGGAISISSSAMTIQHCTFDGNYVSTQGGVAASSDGGAIACDSAAPTNLVLQCTFSGNTATRGSAILNQRGPLTLLHSTLCDNVALVGSRFDPVASALYHDSFTANDVLTIGHTLVARNFFGGINYFSRSGADHRSLGYNLSDDGSFNSLFRASDIVTTDARLGPLMDNGGPTLTHALFPGSPAIDAGMDRIEFTFTSVVTNDVRGPGFPRLVGRAVDIGAFEYASSTAAPLFVAAEKVPAGLSLSAQGLPYELLRVETNGAPGPTGWKAFRSFQANESGALTFTNTGVGAVGRRFYRIVRP